MFKISNKVLSLGFRKTIFYLLLSIVFCKHANAVCPADGSGIIANGVIANNSGCVITTTSDYSAGIGLNASNGANATFSNGSISTSGTGAYGANARDDGTLVTLNNIGINTTAVSTPGLYADNNAHIVMNGGNIATAGLSAYSVLATGVDSLIELYNVDVSTSNSSALRTTPSQGGNIKAIDCTIAAAGREAFAVDSRNGGVVDLSRCTCNPPL